MLERQRHRRPAGQFGKAVNAVAAVVLTQRHTRDGLYGGHVLGRQISTQRLHVVRDRTGQRTFVERASAVCPDRRQCPCELRCRKPELRHAGLRRGWHRG